MDARPRNCHPDPPPTRATAQVWLTGWTGGAPLRPGTVVRRFWLDTVRSPELPASGPAPPPSVVAAALSYVC